MRTEPAAPIDTNAMLDDLKELVEIESPSHNVAALESSAKAVAGIIENRLGGTARLIDSDAGPHVHWCSDHDPKVLILGHHDTVFPIGTLGERPFAVNDGQVTGPGVFDMLGGIVQAVHGVASLHDRSGVEILINSDEEVGSQQSRPLIEERALACGCVLVAEGAAREGALKIGRKGCGTFNVSVEGRTAHAGLEPERGINALVEASHQVLEIADFGRPELGTTVTPTVSATEGTADNVIPATATVSVDVRVKSAAEKNRIEAAFKTLEPTIAGAKIMVEGAIGRPPMPQSSSKELFTMAKKILPGVKGQSVGGGSDGNFTAALGVPTLDGLGAVGGGAHTDNEYLLVDSMAERAELVAGLVTMIQQENGIS